MGQPAARVMDLHVCPRTNGPVPHVGGPIIPPSAPTVLIGFEPAARVTDPCICIGPLDQIASGSSTVLIEHQMAARLGDRTQHGGVIITGMPTVLIGGATASVDIPAHGLLANLEDLGEGIQDEAVDMVKGIGQLLTTNPLTTLENLGHAVTHPSQVWDALSQPYKDAVKSGHPMKGVGRGIVAVGSIFIGGAGVVGKAGEGANIAGKIGEAGSVASKLSELGTAASTAGKIERVLGPAAFEGAEGAAKAAKFKELASQLTTETSAAERSQIIDQLADVSTHGSGDRLVLGEWKGATDGYIGEARASGGKWFEIPDGTYDKIISRTDAESVNLRVLEKEMQNGTKIEFTGNQSVQDILDDPAMVNKARRTEAEYMVFKRGDYGYTRDGSTFSKTK